jgi:hypothetical protein
MDTDAGNSSLRANKGGGHCVYGIPPRKHLLMADGRLIFTDLPYEYGKRSAVDIFFCTLAEPRT